MVAALVAAQVALVAAPASAGEIPLWQVEVAKIPTAKYTRDAKVYVTEATQALRPYVGDGLGESRIDPVLADVASRYFDGARLKSAGDGAAVFDNLQHLESFLKSRLTGASPPSGEAEQAHVVALVETLSGVRLLADAAIQDAEVTIGPFRASPPPAPAPAGLAEAFADLEAAKVDLAKADEMLVKANPEPATIQAENAWSNGFNVLTRLGITYTGDHDNDGVVDVVELIFGASPLLVDSDGDGLTDKFEITALAGWTRPNAVDTDQDSVADGAEDIDGDGLTNLQEQDLGTSPTEADTDGDGLGDGAEVAKGTNPLVPDQPRAPPTPGNNPPIVPAPTDADTDGDGLGDSEEGEVETNPANVDTDGDGLSDGEEYNELNISPLHVDTDGDGLSDGYELEHVLDQGLDPAIFDEQVSKWTYVTDFLLGLAAGSFAERDSLAWLAGNLCSGGLGFIPVVGTALGFLTDVRDAIADAIHGEWVSAGISIVGIVPVVGDSIEIVARLVRFVLKYPRRLLAAVKIFIKNTDIPEVVRKTALKAVLAGDYDNLLAFGLTDDFMLLLGKTGTTDLKVLNKAVAAARRTALRPGFLRDKDAAEDWLWDIMRGSDPPRLGEPLQRGGPQKHIDTPDNPKPRSYRKPDYYEDLPDGSHNIHEMKFGTPYFEEDALKQCHQDGKLKRDGGVGTDRISDVFWHFVPRKKWSRYDNDYVYSLGPTQKLLDCLAEENIPFFIYVP
ncbi:hypothetical protein [Micromonospora kangleipakensis]|uniref:hypothetical protein n=1 Tax=Micromonospora kangleipakensis TaxID=1077942 RepID=UPI001029018C|nr:hypothetical protein [Micromonospora kangleipakensis]